MKIDRYELGVSTEPGSLNLGDTMGNIWHSKESGAFVLYNDIIKKLEEEFFYSFREDGDELFDAEFDNKQEAEEFAQARFEQQCEDDGIKGYARKDIQIVLFWIDDDGEKIEFIKYDSEVEFEDHGTMYEQHNTLWNSV